ncbi:MAG: VWA domain-containing protein [Thermoanaerobaculia bacterium]
MGSAFPVILFLLLFLQTCPRSAFAQEPPAGRFTASVGAEYVQIPVVVRDRKGKFVEDLGRADFHVWVDGAPVAVEAFEKSVRAPVSFAILLDVSGSMRIADKLERAKEAIRTLVELRQRGDDFALFTFSDEEVRIVANFSPDPGPMLRRLFFLKPEGKTALFDAVVQTSNELLSGRNTKKAILLFTDGVDNASQMTSSDVERVMQNESVPVYAIGMKNESYDVLSEQQRKELSLSGLDLLAVSSGGRMFLVGGGDDLRPVASAIERELRRQYVVGFEPSGEGEIRYHPIVVTVTGGGTRIVQSRRGYRGSAPKTVATEK